MNVLNIAMKEFYTSIKSKRFVIILAVYLLFVFLIAYSIKGHFLELTEPQVSRTNLGPFGAEGDTYMTPLSAMLFLNFTFFTIFGAIMGAALGADAINKEVETGTIKVLLGHPVYRDEIINGKFLGNALVLAITILVGYVFTIAFLLIIGVPLDSESFFRGLIAFMMTLLYTLVFLSISILFSTLFKKSETSMLISVGLAIFLTLIYGIIVTLIAGHLAGERPPYGTPAFDMWRENVNLWEQRLHFINPAHHYAKLMILIFSGDRITNTYTPLSEAFSLGFNNLAMILVTLLLPFSVAYVKFMTSDLR
ncbi:ABC transporter permease [Thermococcus paralvinellae]|uniref:ABC-type transport system, permease component n=1 Tax=Thermococcus paralvinellae TaxID=582419 RepID=W0I7B0_9EURY|nr:ABC transporter permease [Thermococcus paralvinellae]AHF80318.1 ABC-type transport system, permease component [Thermococcus paralvinellae]